jgi:hypothetical protein
MGAMKSQMKAAGLVAVAVALSCGAAWGEGVTVTLKGGYFGPTGGVFREVYSGGLTFGADVTVPIGGVFRAWAGVDFFGKTGLLTVSEEETKVRIVPLYVGLRCEFGKGALRPYLGAAAAYFLFHEESPLGSVSDGGVGFLTQAGVVVRLGGPVWIDVHGGYRGCTLKSDDPDPIEAKLDGFSAGLGLAFRF